jgi:RNA polymerase-binding protein DksA
MKKSDLEKFKKLLLEKRRAMVEEMSGFNTRFDETLKERTGDLSSHSYHMADQGTDAMEREMAAMISSKSGRLVYHIDKALERIEKGKYGKCFGCGKQISIVRLEAVPHASFCIDCKSQEEKKNERRRK